MEPRTIRLGVTEKRTADVRPSMRSSSSLPAAAPMTEPPWSTLVSAMLGRAARWVLSYPVTETSAGTRSPASWTAASAPNAAWSAPAKIAVGRGVRFSSSRAPP